MRGKSATEVSNGVNSESKLGAPCPAPPPRTAFPQGHHSPLQGTWVPRACSQEPFPPRCRMNSHRDRERKNTCIGTQTSSTANAAPGVPGEKQRQEGICQREHAVVPSGQLCPRGCGGLKSAVLCHRPWCGPRHISPSAHEGTPQGAPRDASADRGSRVLCR